MGGLSVFVSYIQMLLNRVYIVTINLLFRMTMKHFTGLSIVTISTSISVATISITTITSQVTWLGFSISGSLSIVTISTSVTIASITITTITSQVTWLGFSIS